MNAPNGWASARAARQWNTMVEEIQQPAPRPPPSPPRAPGSCGRLGEVSVQRLRAKQAARSWTGCWGAVMVRGSAVLLGARPRDREVHAAAAGPQMLSPDHAECCMRPGRNRPEQVQMRASASGAGWPGALCALARRTWIPLWERRAGWRCRSVWWWTAYRPSAARR